MAERKRIYDVAKVELDDIQCSDSKLHVISLVIRSLVEPVLEALQLHVDLGFMPDGRDSRPRHAWISIALLKKARESRCEVTVRNIEVMYRRDRKIFEVAHYAPLGHDRQPIAPKICFEISEAMVDSAMELKPALLALREATVAQGFYTLVTMDGVQGKAAAKPAEKPKAEAKVPETAPVEAPKPAPRPTAQPVLAADKAAELAAKIAAVPPAQREADLAARKARKDAAKARKDAARAKREANEVKRENAEAASASQPS